MTLLFPNPIRSFDNTRNAVRFTGYDDLIEVSFYLEAGALVTPIDGEFSQSECLTAFDAICHLVHDAARKVYSRKAGAFYILKTTDF